MPGSGLCYGHSMPGQHLGTAREGNGEPKVGKEEKEENINRKTDRDWATNEKEELAEKGKALKWNHSPGTRTSAQPEDVGSERWEQGQRLWCRWSPCSLSALVRPPPDPPWALVTKECHWTGRNRHYNITLSCHTFPSTVIATWLKPVLNFSADTQVCRKF